MKNFSAIAISSILLVAAISGAQMADAAHFVGYPNAPLPPKNTVVGGTMTANVIAVGGPANDVAGLISVHTFDDLPLSYTSLSSSTVLCFKQAVDLTILTGLNNPSVAFPTEQDIQHVLVDLGSPTGTLGFEVVAAHLTGGSGTNVNPQGIQITIGPFAPVVTVPDGAVQFYLPFSAAAATLQLTNGAPGNFVVPLFGPVGWIQTFGPNVGSVVSNIAHAKVSSTNQLGVCGCDDNNSNGQCGEQAGGGFIADLDGVSEETYFVDAPVAGEIIPIDTSALLIAGIASSSMMILPVLGVAAVAAFGILRFVVKKV